MEFKNWSIIQEDAPFKAPELRASYLHGEVYGNPKHFDGKPVRSTRIKEMRYDKKTKSIMVLTENSIYQIKQDTINPDYAKVFPDAFARMVLAHGGQL